MTDEQRAAYIKGVLAEREAFERAGDTDNVALCDSELKRAGHKAQAPAKRAQTRVKRGG